MIVRIIVGISMISSLANAKNFGTGGTELRDHRSIALIKLKSSSGKEASCNGTVITSQYVLTSESCLQQAPDASSITVTQRAAGGGDATYPVSKILRFDPAKMNEVFVFAIENRNNAKRIAILKVASGRLIRPAPLASQWTCRAPLRAIKANGGAHVMTRLENYKTKGDWSKEYSVFASKGILTSETHSRGLIHRLGLSDWTRGPIAIAIEKAFPESEWTRQPIVNATKKTFPAIDSGQFEDYDKLAELLRKKAKEFTPLLGHLAIIEKDYNAYLSGAKTLFKTAKAEISRLTGGSRYFKKYFNRSIRTGSNRGKLPNNYLNVNPKTQAEKTITQIGALYKLLVSENNGIIWRDYFRKSELNPNTAEIQLANVKSAHEKAKKALDQWKETDRAYNGGYGSLEHARNNNALIKNDLITIERLAKQADGWQKAIQAVKNASPSANNKNFAKAFINPIESKHVYFNGRESKKNRRGQVMRNRDGKVITIPKQNGPFYQVSNKANTNIYAFHYEYGTPLHMEKTRELLGILAQPYNGKYNRKSNQSATHPRPYINVCGLQLEKVVDPRTSNAFIKKAFKESTPGSKETGAIKPNRFTVPKQNSVAVQRT